MATRSQEWRVPAGRWLAEREGSLLPMVPGWGAAVRDRKKIPRNGGLVGGLCSTEGARSPRQVVLDGSYKVFSP